MDRRQFLTTSAAGLAALYLGPSGCGSTGPQGAIVVGERDLRFDPAGAFEILASSHQLARLGPEGGVAWIAGGLGAELDRLNHPVDLARAADGTLYVADHGNRRVLALDAAGRARGVVCAAGPGERLRSVAGVLLDGQGRLHVIDLFSGAIEVFDPAGRPIERLAATGRDRLGAPRDLALDGAGRLHVVDAATARVAIFDGGALAGSYGGHGIGLVGPRSIAIDDLGQAWVADPLAGRVQVFATDGTRVDGFQPRFADGRPAAPLRLRFRDDKTLYIAARPGAPA